MRSRSAFRETEILERLGVEARVLAGESGHLASENCVLSRDQPGRVCFWTDHFAGVSVCPCHFSAVEVGVVRKTRVTITVGPLKQSSIGQAGGLPTPPLRNSRGPT